MKRVDDGHVQAPSSSATFELKPARDSETKIEQLESKKRS